MSFFWDNLFSPNASESLGLWASGSINDLFYMNNNFTTSIFDNNIVHSLLWFISILANLLFVTGIGFAFFEMGVNAHEGNGTHISDVFLNIFKGLLASTCLTTLPVLLLKFTNDICYLICEAFTQQATIEFYYNTISGDTANYFSGWFSAFFFIAAFICVFKVFLGNLKRGGILLTLMFIGSIHIFSVPRGYVDSFFGWCKQVIGLCVTSFMSNILITLGALIYSTNQGADVGDLILSIGVMLSASEVPRIAQQFGLDTSMRANVSQAIFATSGITSIVRSFAH